VCGIDGKPGRFATHAWKHVYEIKDFVISRTPKEDCFVQWQTMMKANSLERASNWLGQCSDAEFAVLKPNRLWHAFQNGLYYVETQHFYKYGDARIPSDVVACKYHDQLFDESILAIDWPKVPVPHLQEVIEYQYPISTSKDSIIPDEGEQERIIMWIYAFVGRMLHEVGSKDKWQVMPFIVGRAGTGKSLLLKCVAHFFNTEDVETLANNSQRGFGLETLIDKLMWMCLEVKNDFTLDQAQLQSMISGETVSVMRKNKTALSVIWTVPGILAGNEVANWVDNSGSMSRRIVLTYWERKVKSKMVDPYLDIKVKSNIGNFLHKSACAYAAICSEFGDRDLWGTYTQDGVEDTILPRYFHACKNRFQVSTDPLMSFLRSESAVVCDDKCRGMSWERFRSSANNYFQKENLKFTWKESKYKAVFEDMSIKKLKISSEFLVAHGFAPNGVYEDYDGQQYTLGTDWLTGVREKDDPVAQKRNNIEDM